MQNLNTIFMKNNLLLIISIVLLSSCANQTDENIRWLKQGGGMHYDAGRQIESDSENNVYVLGSTQGESTFNGIKLDGNDDQIVLLKYEDGGLINWAKSFGGMGDDIGYGMALNKSNDVLITGHFSDSASFDEIKVNGNGLEDAFVSKVNSDGKVLWAKNIGGMEKDFGRGIDVNSNNEIFVSGFCSGDIYCDKNKILATAGKDNLFIIKLDDNGNFIYGKSFASEKGNLRSHSLKAKSNGEVVIVGYLEGTLKINDSTEVRSIGKADAVIISLSKEGEISWVRNVGSKSWDEGYDISLDEQENIYVTGFTSGTSYFGSEDLLIFEGKGQRDAFVIKLNTEGKFLWAGNYGGNGIDEARSIHYKNNALLITGFVEKEGTFGKNKYVSSGLTDVFLLNLSSNNEVLKSFLFGGKEGDEGRAVSFDNEGYANLTGRIKNRANFGKIELREAKDGDVFITKVKLK